MTFHKMTARFEASDVFDASHSFVIDVHDYPSVGKVERGAINCLTREKAERICLKPLAVRDMTEPPYACYAREPFDGACRAVVFNLAYGGAR